jgi:hypothetical protein
MTNINGMINQGKSTGNFSITNLNDYHCYLSLYSHTQINFDMLKLNLIVFTFSLVHSAPMPKASFSTWNKGTGKEGKFC